MLHIICKNKITFIKPNFCILTNKIWEISQNSLIIAIMVYLFLPKALHALGETQDFEGWQKGILN